jgi:hypothetical protein
MPVRNLYLVLGIPPDATPEMIRSAYRTLVKQVHPDRVGPRGTSQFRDIVEAYRVLSDPQSRDAYNRELHLPPTNEGDWPAPFEHERGPAEPLPLVIEPIALRRSLHTSHPSVEEDFLDWTRRYFTDSHVPKSERQRYADVEVVLSPVEAEVGGVLPLHVPAFAVCPACGGRGRDWFSICLECNGGGVVESRRTVWLYLPRRVRDGAVWEVSVPEGGVRLRVRVRVDPYGW